MKPRSVPKSELLRSPVAVVAGACLAMVAAPGSGAVAFGAEVQWAPLVGHEAERVVAASEFGQPSALEVGPDGRLYAAYPMEGMLRVVEREGGIVRTISLERVGGLRPPWRIGWASDSLWVMGRRGSGVAFVDPAGRPLRTASFEFPRGTGEIQPFRVVRILPGDRALIAATGSPLATAVANPQLEGRRDAIIERLPPVDPLPRLPLWLVGSGGQILDTVAWLSTRHRTALLLTPAEGDGKAGFVLAAQPFADDPLMHVDPTGRHIAVVERAVSGGEGEPSFTVLRISPEGDTVVRRRHAMEPVPLRAEWAERVIRREAERVGDDLAEGTAIAREGLFIPKWLPPASDVRVGRDGWMWVRREAVPGDRTVRWEILDPQGERQGWIGIPAGWSVEAISRTSAWAVERDETGGGLHLWHVRMGVDGARGLQSRGGGTPQPPDDPSPDAGRTCGETRATIRRAWARARSASARE